MPTSAVSALILFHWAGNMRSNSNMPKREQGQQNDGERHQVVDPAEILRHVAGHLFGSLRLIRQPALRRHSRASLCRPDRSIHWLHAGIIFPRTV